MSIQRLDPYRVRIHNHAGVDVTLFANEDVFIDNQSVDEIVRFAGVAHTVDQLRDHGFFGDVDARLRRIVLTPDFHRGAGIPIGTVIDAQGFVIPRAVGGDIGCVDPDTEFLSPSGWIRIADWDGQDVCQFNPQNGAAEFVNPIRYIKRPSEKLIHFKTKYGIDQALSFDHRMLVYHFTRTYDFSTFGVETAESVYTQHNNLKNGYRHRIRTAPSSLIRNTKLGMSDDEIRVVVMLCADGRLHEYGNRCTLNLKKERKISRARELLQKAGIPITHEAQYGDRTAITIDSPIVHRSLGQLWDASSEQLEIITDEVFHWDGNHKERCFYTRDKQSADFVNYAFMAVGYRSVLREDIHYRDGQTDYRVFAHLNTKIGINGTPKSVPQIIQSPDGFEYCFEVPSSFFIIRRNGNVAITGNCGMRLLTTDVTTDEFARLGDALDRKLRHIFFEGGRDIAMSARQREAMFRYGIQGLLSEDHADAGIWRYWCQDRQEEDVMRSHLLGCLPTDGVFALDDFIRGSGAEFSRDDQIGSIGAGNHFVEIQQVDHLYDFHTASSWGLKSGTITIMAHTGSVSIGQMVGKHFMDVAKQAYVRGMRHPSHDFYVLPSNSKEGRAYLSAMNNAANFAFANRLFLGLMVVRALTECLGREIETRLVYDAPHNLIWSNGDNHLHRKGACPAGGPSYDPEFPYGHPVIIPGSMGSHSYIMRGNGLSECLCSACHGAGRMSPRQTARKAEISEFNSLRVVTKVDLHTVRRDVADELKKSLLEEAPSMYKGITPVIDTVSGAGIADRVASVWPLLTIKGL